MLSLDEYLSDNSKELKNSVHCDIHGRMVLSSSISPQAAEWKSLPHMKGYLFQLKTISTFHNLMF